MTLHWVLYFGLGFLSLIPFTARFLIQWILSERKKESYVTSLFWVLSIAGNMLMSVHYLVQIQFHLYFIRIFPLYIAYRQWNLMQKNAYTFSWSKLIKSISFLAIGFCLLFAIRVYLQYHEWIWIKNMQMPWQASAKEVFWHWHIVGIIGSALFISRHIVQWWQSERLQKSVLSKAFWWLSLTGGSVTLLYAVLISDYVTALGYVAGLIPYTRNLMLMYRTSIKGVSTR